MGSFVVRSALSTLAVGLLLLSSVYAQEENVPETSIREIRQAYRDLEYEQAEQMAREVLTDGEQLTIDQLMEVHRLLGLIEISQNDRASARRHFEAALSLNPDLTLDPNLVSPKIIDFFQEVRRAYLTDAARAGSDSVSIRYRLISDPRPEAALRSALLPGWGQLYKGETVKGRLLLGLWGVSAGGAVVTHVLGRVAENSQENDPGLSDSGRNRAEWWSGARNGLIAMAAGTWLVSYLDALLSRGTPSKTADMYVAPNSRLRPHITLRVHF